MLLAWATLLFQSPHAAVAKPMAQLPLVIDKQNHAAQESWRAVSNRDESHKFRAQRKPCFPMLKRVSP